ncbi:hypothetical protein Sj15T_01770 [Sphingobium sp. TA15]|uniref:Uncharacterized protein n=1 Tax=Sphingobium indicum (strain DSM 16413 / CCM 7287 / MTCC 6362 / UT26 / NBRC 101211 / UT26S) TaxID=452662 RepID=D4YZQ6_SPHIU|nr:hypothetical protein [Sphingobium indicum]BAI95838.1 hypothetical protein SJA_C1-10040 [Sphingobium indicum UT26S]BDD65156.1 hypothetical protein Sj15T_01770 [Sphingobium sp. TA15]
MAPHFCGAIAMFKPTVTGPSPAQFRELERQIREKAESALLKASHQGGKIAVGRIQGAMARAGLGRLGNAVEASSDLEKGGRLHRSSAREVSASSAVHLKSRNERTVGAIEAYTRGANIRPRNARWLWIPSPELQRRVKGGGRVEPSNWKSSGLEQRIGPLVQIPGKHSGEVLLIVPAVTVATSGKARPRRLPKRGGVRPGRELRENFIAFTGIRSTSRQARVDPLQIIDDVRAELPTLLARELEK